MSRPESPELPPACLLQFIEGSQELGEIVFEEGVIETLVCDQAGRIACNYSCTIRFGKNNEIADIVDDSGTPACI
jgi:hypothetical protein